MQKTSIEYLDYTYNPVKMLCTSVSSGCANCSAIKWAKMLANNPSIYADHQRAYKGGPPVLDYEELEAPLHLRKPARIGVQLMGDFLHDSIDGFWISAIWGIMQRCPQHKFFLLTKRPERFLRLTPPLPVLENVWFGISVEDQKNYDERSQILFQILAAHYWISHEPGLGLIDFNGGPAGQVLGECDLCGGTDSNCPGCEGKKGIELVVCGGETGYKARPMHPDIPRHDRDQCQTAGVKFFFKSWGEWKVDYEHTTHIVMRNGIFEPINQANCCSGVAIRRVGHKNSGRLLDNHEYNEMP